MAKSMAFPFSGWIASTGSPKLLGLGDGVMWGGRLGEEYADSELQSPGRPRLWGLEIRNSREIALLTTPTCQQKSETSTFVASFVPRFLQGFP